MLLHSLLTTEVQINIIPVKVVPFGKPRTAGDVAPTPSSSAGILLVQGPSVDLSRPFGCSPQFQNDDL